MVDLRLGYKNITSVIRIINSKKIQPNTFLSKIALFSIIWFASCSPRFENPIPMPSDLKVDTNILGTWVRTTESGSEEVLSIFPRKTGWIDVVYIYDTNSSSSADGLNILIFEGFSSSISNHKIACARFRKKDYPCDNSLDAFYFISSYEINKDNKLIIKPFSLEKVEALIDEGKLKGEIIKKEIPEFRPFDEVKVNSSPKEILQVVEEVGVEYFWGDGEFDIFIFEKL